MVRDYLAVYHRQVYGGSGWVRSAPATINLLALSARDRADRRTPASSQAIPLGVLHHVE